MCFRRKMDSTFYFGLASLASGAIVHFGRHAKGARGATDGGIALLAEGMPRLVVVVKIGGYIRAPPSSSHMAILARVAD